MRNDPTGLAVCQTPTDRLHDVQVVEHVIEAAIIRQTVEERPNSIFGGHGTSGMMPRVYGRHIVEPSF
jgi:hypothetical protein